MRASGSSNPSSRRRTSIGDRPGLATVVRYRQGVPRWNHRLFRDRQWQNVQDLPATSRCGCDEAGRGPSPPGSWLGEVLIVEDDNQLHQILRRYLASWGYTVLDAPSSLAALEILHDHVGSIDFLLTDLVIAGIDGRSLSLRAYQPTAVAVGPGRFAFAWRSGNNGVVEMHAVDGTKVREQNRELQRRQARNGPAVGSYLAAASAKTVSTSAPAGTSRTGARRSR
jgi:response regulator receiver domain-containing protein